MTAGWLSGPVVASARAGFAMVGAGLRAVVSWCPARSRRFGAKAAGYPAIRRGIVAFARDSASESRGKTPSGRDSAAETRAKTVFPRVSATESRGKGVFPRVSATETRGKGVFPRVRAAWTRPIERDVRSPSGPDGAGAPRGGGGWGVGGGGEVGGRYPGEAPSLPLRVPSTPRPRSMPFSAFIPLSLHPSVPSSLRPFFDQIAFPPRSPVRMRMQSSRGMTKILPSPTEPERAPAQMASTARVT